jgi:hypothetical protein
VTTIHSVSGIFGIAVNHEQDIFVTLPSANAVKKFTKEGIFLFVHFSQSYATY